MRNIFIDLGAYTGDTIRKFLNRPEWVLPGEFEIYGFEPNPDLQGQLQALALQNKNVKIEPWAAWVENGSIEFSVDKAESPLGSSVMRSKKNWEAGEIIRVACFDFSAWIKQFAAGCYVIVKMDIEGAEFPVLKKMLTDGTIKIMNELDVEFHPNKVRDYTTKDKEKLIGEIGNQTKLRDWH